MIPIEDIRKNYEKYDDATILKIIRSAKDLRTEVVSVLNDEIRKRNLDVNLIEFVKDETNFYEGAERELLVREIRNTVCTNCNYESELHGYTFNTLMSFILECNHEQKAQIICTSCAKKLRLKSMLTTLALGWWSRYGLFATPATLISDLIEMARKEKYSDRLINNFIDNHTGSIRRVKKGNGEISIIIRKFNQKKQEVSD